MDNVTQPTVLSFMSEGCPHCVRFKPTFAEVAAELNASKKATALAVSAELAQQGVPTTVIYRGDGSPPVVLPGNRPKEVLQSTIQKVLNGEPLSPSLMGGNKPASKMKTAMDRIMTAIYTNKHRELFAPDVADINFIGWQHVEGGLSGGGNDAKLYMMLVNTQDAGTPMMAVFGSVRDGGEPLQTQVFSDPVDAVTHMMEAANYVTDSKFMSNALQSHLGYRRVDDVAVPSLSSLM